MIVATAAARPDLWARAEDLDADVWPEYNRHGDVLNRYWGRLDELLRPEPESLLITGTVPEWESSTGLPLPESGTYVFPHGLAPLEVGRDRDLGTYWEPNVWVRHAAAAG